MRAIYRGLIVLVIGVMSAPAAAQDKAAPAALFAAVKSGKVYVVPVGAHTWSNRTAEQPLTVLWAVETFHPGRLKDLNLAAEAKRFYRDFFDHDLADAAVTEILSGTL